MNRNSDYQRPSEKVGKVDEETASVKLPPTGFFGCRRMSKESEVKRLDSGIPELQHFILWDVSKLRRAF
ncbi:hypothetical protein E5D57_013802 [Metarhizium anisopliae]|nr:hypothetical protein E5D57_013788 [Metarhizium anisopliae]KAF5120448.1 hypothetical protein E5D57_013802 [Metarhizium anisopliae]